MFKNALVSTSDKTGLVEFLKPLVARGLRVVSTGGTSKHLRDNGIAVVEVAEQTGFPEVMDGRVRTLHPSIHMPILARANESDDMKLLADNGLEAFDLVIVNLYPFADALAKGAKGQELIEYIDIGGPSLLRAAAKNHERIAVVCDPADYAWLAQAAIENKMSLEQKRALAAKVFAHTSSYDTLIAQTLAPAELSYASLNGELVQELRYGENPQQRALWMKNPGATDGLHAAEILHGKALSYNNLLDLDCAVRAVRDFSDVAATVAVKHGNPCGIGTASDVGLSVARALAADPVSVFGGIIAINRKLDIACAQALAKLFIECVIAPDYDEAALEILKKKKDLRLLRWPTMLVTASETEFRTVTGGYILQTADSARPGHGEAMTSAWNFVGETPSALQMTDLRLAWIACAHLKSNAIALACDGMSIGLGMGQVNRVDAVEQALIRAAKHHPDLLARAVLASDAFFPFADSIELIAKSGVRWVVQPGGSMRDNEVIARAKDLGVNLVLTGRRHFRH